jgi:hypothetical protein
MFHCEAKGEGMLNFTDETKRYIDWKKFRNTALKRPLLSLDLYNSKVLYLTKYNGKPYANYRIPHTLNQAALKIKRQV